MAGWSRRQVLAGLTATAAGLPRRAQAAKRPNILFIMTDQHRADALSCADQTGLFDTPNLDRLAASGVRFTHHFAASPLCTPARASLLTGLPLDQHGLTRNIERDTRWRGRFQTWEEQLSGAGYHCRYYGKWHTGSGHDDHYIGGVAAYRRSYRAHIDARYPDLAPRAGEEQDRYYQLPYMPLPIDRMMLDATKRRLHMQHHNEAGEIRIAPEDTPTAFTVDQVRAFLKKAPEPFSVTCSILSPHSPMLLPRRWLGRHDPARVPLPTNIEDDYTLPRPAPIPTAIPADASGLGSFIALYADLVEEVDHHIGRLLATLDEQGLAERTIVVFTADHGEMMGSHGTLAKSLLFEEAVRVPLIIRQPGGPRGVRDGLTTALDIAPTLLARAGIRADLPGRDLLSRTGAPDAVVSELALASGRARMIRTPTHKLVLRDGEGRLYDLTADPGEQRNLLQHAPTRQDRALARALQEQLVSWCREHRAKDTRATARVPL